MREIVIKPTTKKGDLLKLAAVLVAENGVLEDEHRRIILKIIKGQTTAGQVAEALMGELHNNLGHEFSITYHPESHVGGQFLDGFLSLRNNRALVPLKFGGGMTSSGFIHQNPKHALAELPIHVFTGFGPRVMVF